MAPYTGLASRDAFSDDDYYTPWWYTTTGYIVRWTLFGIVVAIVLLWTVGGYFHARHRIKKGLPPMAYHSCFFPRQPRMYQSGWYRPGNPYGQPQDGYYMNQMPPPPTYDANRPPEYQQGPPPGATKVDPSQWRNEPTSRPAESSTTGAGPLPDYQAPPGPPPAATRQ